MDDMYSSYKCTPKLEEHLTYIDSKYLKSGAYKEWNINNLDEDDCLKILGNDFLYYHKDGQKLKPKQKDAIKRFLNNNLGYLGKG